MSTFWILLWQLSIFHCSFAQVADAALTANYTIQTDFTVGNFFDYFNFYTGYDPTNGHVQYVNRSIAASQGYISTNSTNTYIGVDTIGQYPKGGRGRPSVRIVSQQNYTHGLFILDLAHMPFGCGTWPAFWTLGPNWPTNGEIDIIEGVNVNSLNAMTLHSSQNCTIAGSGMSGKLVGNNCAYYPGYNAGCGITSPASGTAAYGSGFNSNGGGVYAMEWTSLYIRMWFFPRSNIPASMLTMSPNVTEFGLPTAMFQGSCQIDKHFFSHQIIFNIDFCGDWAGPAFSTAGCPKTLDANASSWDQCVNWVGTQPSNFTDAYWLINSLRIFQDVNGASSNNTSASTSITSITPAASTGTVSGAPAMGVSGLNTSVQPTVSIASSAPISPTTSVTFTSSTPPAAATSPVCPASNQTIYTNPAGTSLMIDCGADDSGGTTLNTLLSQTYQSCLDACHAADGCVRISYVSNTRVCYLKKIAGTPKYSNTLVWGAHIVAQGAGQSGSSSVSSSASTVSGSSTLTLSPVSSSSGSSFGQDVSPSMMSAGSVQASSLNPTVNPMSSSVASVLFNNGAQNSASSASMGGSIAASMDMPGSSNLAGSLVDSSTAVNTVLSSASPSPVSSTRGTAPAVQTPVECPGSNATTYTGANGAFMVMCYTSLANAGTFDSSIQGRTTPTVELCMDRCATTPSCVAIAWVLGGKACYLKAAITVTKYDNTGVIAAFLIPNSNPASIAASQASAMSASSAAVLASSSALFNPSPDDAASSSVSPSGRGSISPSAAASSRPTDPMPSKNSAQMMSSSSMTQASSASQQTSSFSAASALSSNMVIARPTAAGSQSFDNQPGLSADNGSDHISPTDSTSPSAAGPTSDPMTTANSSTEPADIDSPVSDTKDILDSSMVTASMPLQSSMTTTITSSDVPLETAALTDNVELQFEQGFDGTNTTYARFTTNSQNQTGALTLAVNDTSIEGAQMLSFMLRNYGFTLKKMKRQAPNCVLNVFVCGEQVLEVNLLDPLITSDFTQYSTSQFVACAEDYTVQFKESCINSFAYPTLDIANVTLFQTVFSPDSGSTESSNGGGVGGGGGGLDGADFSAGTPSTIDFAASATATIFPSGSSDGSGATGNSGPGGVGLGGAGSGVSPGSGALTSNIGAVGPGPSSSSFQQSPCSTCARSTFTLTRSHSVCSPLRHGTVTVFTTAYITSSPQKTVTVTEGQTPTPKVCDADGLSSASICYTCAVTPVIVCDRIVYDGELHSPPAPTTSHGPDWGKPTCPGDMGRKFTDSYGMIYDISCDTDYMDSNVDLLHTDDLGSCIAACDGWNVQHFAGDRRCKGVSFYESGKDTDCFLKADTLYPVTRKGVSSGKLLTVYGNPGKRDDTMVPQPPASTTSDPDAAMDGVLRSSQYTFGPILSSRGSAGPASSPSIAASSTPSRATSSGAPKSHDNNSNENGNGGGGGGGGEVGGNTGKSNDGNAGAIITTTIFSQPLIITEGPGTGPETAPGTGPGTTPAASATRVNGNLGGGAGGVGDGGAPVGSGGADRSGLGTGPGAGLGTGVRTVTNTVITTSVSTITTISTSISTVTSLSTITTVSTRETTVSGKATTVISSITIATTILSSVPITIPVTIVSSFPVTRTQTRVQQVTVTTGGGGSGSGGTVTVTVRSSGPSSSSFTCLSVPPMYTAGLRKRMIEDYLPLNRR